MCGFDVTTIWKAICVWTIHVTQLH